MKRTPKISVIVTFVLFIFTSTNAPSEPTSANIASLIAEANNNNTKAQEELAHRFLKGDGVAQDLDESYKWFTRLIQNLDKSNKENYEKERAMLTEKLSRKENEILALRAEYPNESTEYSELHNSANKVREQKLTSIQESIENKKRFLKTALPPLTYDLMSDINQRYCDEVYELCEKVSKKYAINIEKFLQTNSRGELLRYLTNEEGNSGKFDALMRKAYPLTRAKVFFVNLDTAITRFPEDKQLQAILARYLSAVDDYKTTRDSFHKSEIEKNRIELAALEGELSAISSETVGIPENLLKYHKVHDALVKEKTDLSNSINALDSERSLFVKNRDLEIRKIQILIRDTKDHLAEYERLKMIEGPKELSDEHGANLFKIVNFKKEWYYKIDKEALDAKDWDGAVFFTPRISFEVENISDTEITSLDLRFIIWDNEKQIFDETTTDVVYAHKTPLRPKMLSVRQFVRTSMGYKGRVDFQSYSLDVVSPRFDKIVEVQYRLGSGEWKPYCKFRLILERMTFSRR